ncbi:brassinosteroid LRR receptor kinase-like [Arachis hypogaea]|uniref:brassinosteroid LRR receptor kinase-like n=1 Tax=Arachis hypogaea TaxID=3818 RepID=UPI000DEC89D8|nr:Leucine-rich repeat receptor-like serine/threonine-protein kinase [Arachis hypogaea]
MQVLKLWQNKFTGSIPSRLGQNGKLTELDLSTNKLKGLVPKSLCFGKLKSVLEILLLHGNRFSGEIPLDIGKLKSVLKMDLSVNNFSGAIPPEICANTKFIAFMITYGLSAAARVQLWK